MSAYHEALALFQEKHYAKAKHRFYQCVVDSSLSHDDVEDCFQKLLLIANLESHPGERIRVLLSFADYRVSKENWAGALPLIESVRNIDPEWSMIDQKKKLGLQLISLYEKTGAFEEEWREGKRLLDLCIQRKWIEEGWRLTEHLKRRHSLRPEMSLARVYFATFKHDIPLIGIEMNALYRLILRERDLKVVLSYHKHLTAVIQLWHADGIDQEAPALYNEWLLRKTIDNAYIEKCILGYNRTMDSAVKKTILKTMIEWVLMTPTPTTVTVVKTYYEITQNQKMIQSITAFATKMKWVLPEYPLATLISDHALGGSISPASPKENEWVSAVTLAEIQNGPDILLNSVKMDSARSDVEHIHRLERDFLFLEKSGKHDEAKKVAKSIMRLDPENALLQRRILRAQLARPTSSSSPEHVIAALLQEISQFTTDSGNEDSRFIERIELDFMKQFQMVDLSFAEAKDYFVLFLTMGLHRLAKQILKKVQEHLTDDGDEQERMELVYLEVMALLESGELYEALELVHFVNHTYALNPADQICFAYLQAEVLFRLERWSDAQAWYRRVAKWNKNYRLVAGRLRTLEGRK